LVNSLSYQSPTLKRKRNEFENKQKLTNCYEKHLSNEESRKKASENFHQSLNLAKDSLEFEIM